MTAWVKSERELRVKLAKERAKAKAEREKRAKERKEVSFKQPFFSLLLLACTGPSLSISIDRGILASVILDPESARM